MVQGHRPVKAVAGGVVINDLKVFAYRSLTEIIFPFNLEDNLVYDGCVQLDREAWVKGVSTQPAVHRLGTTPEAFVQ